jgi:hypothetical protein
MDMQQPDLSPETLLELEKISLETLIDPLPSLDDLPITASAIMLPPTVTEVPNLPEFKGNPKNWCGQAAVTSVTERHKRNKFTGRNRLQDLLNNTYKWYPPDIFHGTFGTSANRMVSALKDYGFKRTVSLRLEPWLPFGLTNPANRLAYAAYSNMVFAYVNAGWPAIVMVDNGKLGDDWHNYHWMVLYRATDTNVYVCNAVNKVQTQYHNRSILPSLFAEAWEAPYLPPGFRFNAVIAIT